MTNLLQQLPALIGVVVGTIGTILATTIAERARWRRNQRTRWDERRLEAYMEYARAVKDVHALALRLVAPDVRGAGSHPLDRCEGLAKLAEADAHRTKVWESVLLLGDAEAVAAAREWRDAVGAVERFARGPAPEQPEIEAGIRRVNEARDSFYAAARHSLGLYGGSVAQSDWLAVRWGNPDV